MSAAPQEAAEPPPIQNPANPTSEPLNNTTPENIETSLHKVKTALDHAQQINANDLHPEDILTPERKVSTLEEARSILTKLRDTMMERMGLKKNSPMKPIPGKGIIAPGTDFEVFITRNTIKKSTSGKARIKSISLETHYLAASNIDRLWAKSFPRDIEPDKQGNEAVKGIHKRTAYMQLGDDIYQVKLTAKEFHSPKDINHLYSVEVEDIIKEQSDGKPHARQSDPQSTRQTLKQEGTSEANRQSGHGSPLPAPEENIPQTTSQVNFSVIALDKNGQTIPPAAFVTKKDGNPDWFTIPSRKEQTPMPVRMLIGEDKGTHKGYGLAHITASRDLDGLWAHTSPEKYLTGILENVSELWEIAPGRELLVKGKKPSSWLVLQLVRQDGYYSIVTAHPVAGSKKPNGKKLPLAERVAGKNQTRVDRSQRPANPDAAPGAFPGGQETKAAAPASTAGGGVSTTLPQEAQKVNIDEITLHFDDGGTMPASFSLAQAAAISKHTLAPRGHEARADALMHSLDEAIGRWNNDPGPGSPRHSTARTIGEITPLLAEIQNILPGSYKTGIPSGLTFGAAIARMLGAGLGTYGNLATEKQETLATAVQTLMDSPYIQTAIRDEIAGVREKLEQHLKDTCVAKIIRRLDLLIPRKKDNGKYGKQTLPAEASRTLGQYIAMLEADASTVQTEKTRLETLIQQTTPGQGAPAKGKEKTYPHEHAGRPETLTRSQLADKLADWQTFGNLKGMTLDQTRSAMEAIITYILTSPPSSTQNNNNNRKQRRPRNHAPLNHQTVKRDRPER